MAEVTIAGGPTAGSFDPNFLIPPLTTSPRTGHGLHDTITWQLPAGQTHQMTQIGLSSDLGWGGIALTGEETEITLPMLPSTSNEAEVFAAPVQMAVQIQRCTDLPGPCDALSRDTPALLTP